MTRSYLLLVFVSLLLVTTVRAACNDGVQDGNETAIDCGGPCMTCQAACFDGRKDGNETDIDCGGNTCISCADACFDGRMDGNETMIDCGGGTCIACELSCTDGRKDADETDVDWGGTYCPSCQLSTTRSCTNPCGLGEPNHNMNPQVRQYDQLTSRYPVAINLNGRNKTAFYPMVDEFSLLTLPLFNNTISGIDRNQSTFYVQVQFGSKYTGKQLYRYVSDGVQYVVPFFTVVITLNNGFVENLDWDTGCQACTDAECNNNICGTPETNCQPAGNLDCDLKVYLAWSGSDDNNRYMLSSGSVISRFTSYSIKNAYDSAARTASTTYPGGRGAF